MNILQIDHNSVALNRKTTFKVLLGENLATTKIMLLLHGRGDDCHAWSNYTNVIRYAHEKNYTVIFPSGDISFYVNRLHGEHFQEYLFEVVDLVFSTFSIKEQKIIVGGNSMGGYGALRFGILNPHLVELLLIYSSPQELSSDYLKTHPDCFLKDDLTPLDNYVNEIKDLNLYVYCGKKDLFYEANKNFCDRFKIPLYTDENGHTWDAWEEQIKKYFREIN